MKLIWKSVFIFVVKVLLKYKRTVSSTTIYNQSKGVIQYIHGIHKIINNKTKNFHLVIKKVERYIINLIIINKL